MDPPYVDSFRAFTSLGDVVGGLHPHEGVHPYAKGFFNAERHFSGKIGLAIQKGWKARAGKREGPSRRPSPSDLQA